MASTELDLGDIAGHSATIPDGSVLVVVKGKVVALHPGTNGQSLQANDAEDNGVEWA